MKLLQLAHARSGDKGNICNISVIALRPDDYTFLKRELTTDRVLRHLAPIVTGPVERYELDSLRALNFVLHEALAGGVSRSLALDTHGKCYSSVLLEIDLPEPETTDA